MVSDLIRDAPLGQVIRYLSKTKVFLYPEESGQFECPSCYAQSTLSDASTAKNDEAYATRDSSDLEKLESIKVPDAPTGPVDLERAETVQEPAEGVEEDTQRSLKPVHTLNLTKTSTRAALAKSQTLKQLEDAFAAAALEKNMNQSQRIEPERLDDGITLVDWYTTDDPANPQNWSLAKKSFVTFQICIYTTAVYMGSAIYSPSEAGVSAAFDVGPIASSLGLSLYVLAYGLGPMIWSPLSEIPVIGRNPPYILTFAIFVILCVPTALVDNFAGLLVLRFLQGFFGSPCLATGGASLQDMFSLIKVPYVLSLWAFAATCGPALGPIISGFSVTAENWRWSLWEMLWLAGPIWLLMACCLPETSPSNILLHRAQRLRNKSGNSNLKSQSEIDQANISISHIVTEALWRPNQMMILDPAVGFTALYTALMYGIYYSFFEVFPLVYIDIYGFNVGELGLAFLSISVGVGISMVTYWSFIWFVTEPEIRSKGLGAPERRLIPALPASFLCPIGLFLFGWTSRPDIHWIVPTLGIMFYTIGIFLIIQCIFIYLALSYPQYAASLFAGNDLARSTLASAAILFSRPMYLNLGVGPGCSLLGGLTSGCIAGIFVLFFFGDKLRARSRFAAT